MPTPQKMTVQLALGEFEQVISVAGEIDISNAAHLTRFVARLVDCADGDVSLDLAEVSYIDSTGLSVLLQARQRLLAHGRRLAVRNPSPEVIAVLNLCGLSGHVAAANDVHVVPATVAATV